MEYHQICRPRYGSTDAVPVPVEHPDGHYQEFELQSYHEAQARARAANLHAFGDGAREQSSPGILAGLTVTLAGSSERPAVFVGPGIAVDGLRRVIVLAARHEVLLASTGEPNELIYVRIRYGEKDNSSPTDPQGGFPRPSTFDFGVVESVPVVEMGPSNRDLGDAVLLAILKRNEKGVGFESVFARGPDSQRRVAGQTAGEFRVLDSRSQENVVADSCCGKLGATERGELQLSSPAGVVTVEGELRVEGRIVAQPGTFVPVGTVLPHVGAWPPKDADGSIWDEWKLGWVLCDGRSFDPQAYPELRATLGENELPDLAGKVARGRQHSQVAGETGGSDVISGQATHRSGDHNHALPQRTSWVARIPSNQSLASPRYSVKDDHSGWTHNDSGGQAHLAVDGGTNDEGQHVHGIGGATSGGGAHTHPIPDITVIPRFVSVNFIIRVIR